MGNLHINPIHSFKLVKYLRSFIFLNCIFAFSSCSFFTFHGSSPVIRWILAFFIIAFVCADRIRAGDKLRVIAMVEFFFAGNLGNGRVFVGGPFEKCGGLNI